MSAALRNPAIVQQFLSAPMTEFRNDEENLSVATHMNYTRLFQQLPDNSPLTGLRHSCSCWRSVIHTRRSAKISSNVTFFYLSVQPRAAIVKAVAREV